ncbi:MAG: hypothetical protein QW660_03290 [Candidatus Bathyarchaeia archaeon]
MEKIAKSFLLGVILLTSLIVVSPTLVRAELPPAGDLTLLGNDVIEVANAMLTVNGSIIIKNNATLRIINSSLTFNSINYNITLKEPSNGNPRLIIINSSISCRTTENNKGFSVYIYGNSSISIKNSYIERAIINARDTSKIDVQNLIASVQMNLYKSSMLNASLLNFISVKAPRFTPRLECFDGSRAFISNTIAEEAIYIRGRGSSIITLKNCVTKWTIELYEKSSLYLSGGKVEGRINLYDASNAEIISPYFLKNLNASGHANAKIYDTTIIFSTTEKTVLSESSALFMEKVNVRQKLLLLDNARLSAINSQFSQVEMYNITVLSALDTRFENLAAYGTSTFFVSGKSQLNGTFHESSLAFIINTYSADSRILATDNAHIIISKSTIPGKIGLEKKATLYATESNLEFLEIKDNVVANMTKTTINSYLGIFDSAKVAVIDTKVNILSVSKTSESIIEKSNVHAINAFDSSKIYIYMSFVSEITIYINSVQCTFENLGYTATSSAIHTIPGKVVIVRRGYAPTITYTSTEVKNWNVFIMGDSSVNFTNCRLDTLMASGNSSIKFFNTTASRVTMNNNSHVHVYWYLDVVAYNGTSVLVKNGEGEVVFQTNVMDRVRIILLERIINASTTIVSNRYVVVFNKDGQQQQYDIELTSSMVIDLTASKGFEWYNVLIIVIIVIVALLIALVKSHKFPKGIIRRPKK